MGGDEMSGAKKLVQFLFFLAFIWCSVNAARPYYDKYRLQLCMEAAAIHGTKNSIEDVRAFLDREMLSQGFGFEGEDFDIEKEENNHVTISLNYIDEIRVFGPLRKEIEMVLKASADEVSRY
jgi:hypothetical protein